ncbi:MAG: MBL fold metallo-hydrolase [Myxococcales bacterium]|nr:MBL fold metallo-hydrolase [Myxococcales bacterium]
MEASDRTLSVRFWGVRGSIACPGQATVRYGGNTSCIEVRCSDRLLILDAGTGLRCLGDALRSHGPLDVDLLLTHTHIDHISGLPFFRPLGDASNVVRMWAGHLRPHHSLQQVLQGYMSDPLFPVSPSKFSADVTYLDFQAGRTLELAHDVIVRTTALNHPQGATGYRVEHGGRSVCYVTDTEHVPGERHAGIVELSQGADLLIYDCTYTDEEFDAHVGWGHSTWQEGVRLADAADVGTLVLFHHDPSHDDDVMDRIAAEAARARPGTLTAREGMRLELTAD